MVKKTQPDKVEKILEGYPDVFADIINVLVFDGLEVIKSQNLIDGPTESIYKAEEGNYELLGDKEYHSINEICIYVHKCTGRCVKTATMSCILHRLKQKHGMIETFKIGIFRLMEK